MSLVEILVREGQDAIIDYRKGYEEILQLTIQPNIRRLIVEEEVKSCLL